MTILEWIIVTVFGINGFVWLVLPWFIIGRNDCLFKSCLFPPPASAAELVLGT